MDLIKEMFKRLLCNHNYKFRARYVRIKNGKVKCFEDYQCSKCKKRKEKRV